MHSTLKKTNVGLLGLFLAFPVLVQLAVGSAEPFVHGEPQPDWPAPIDLIAPKSRGRDRLADAFFDRSALRRETIRLRNGLTLYGLGYIDTPLVVSGAPGWLFYKPSLTAWSCDQHAALDHGLHRLQLLLDLPDANEIPLVIASAPNKASAQKLRRSGRAALYARCYVEYEARYRAALRNQSSPRLVDHAEVVDAELAGQDTFVPTDTHWTRQFAYRAMAQLAERVESSEVPAQAPKIELAAKRTDLGNQILMLGDSEMSPSAVLARSPRKKLRTNDIRVVVLHDSFYQEAPDYLKAFLPGVVLFNINQDEFKSQSFEDADILVLESVERQILPRLRAHNKYGWSSSVGDWIQTRASEAAEDCVWSEAVDLLPEAKGKNLTLGARGRLRATSMNAKLFSSLPNASARGSYCLELEIATDEARSDGRAVRVFLDARNSQLSPSDLAAEFVHGRSIEFHYGSDRSRLAFVLPRSALGRRIRLDFQDLRRDTRLVALRIAPSAPRPTPAAPITARKRAPRSP